MKPVQGIAIGVGISLVAAAYVAAQNKHLLFDKLPQPEDFNDYCENPNCRFKFYLIDKGIVIFQQKEQRAWISVDLETGEKRYLSPGYVEELDMPGEHWKVAGGKSLIVYLVKILGKVIKISLYEHNISRGISIIEDYLQNIEKMLEIFKVERRIIEFLANTSDVGWELKFYFRTNFPLIETPQGRYKAGCAKILSKPWQEFRVILEEQQISKRTDNLLSAYPDGVSLEKLAEIVIS